MGASPIAIRPHQATGLDDDVRAARTGDFSAFEQLYYRHVGGIRALCLRMTADPSRADEMTQQAFIRAWERLASFRGECGFGGWLHRVAVNVVLADRRSAGRRRAREGGELDAPSAFEPSAAPRSPGARLDLEAAIGRLPRRARDVFVLHDIEGYRHDEVGEMLGIASGTSKAQLHRARRLLREALTP